MSALKIIGYPNYTIELKECDEGCVIMSYKRKNPSELKIYKHTNNKDDYKSWNITLVNEQGKRKHLKISRLIVQHFKPEIWKPDLQVDHIDVNSLNNRLDNLQMVTNLENCNKQSTNPRKDNTSGHKNICYDKGKKKWEFKKIINGIRHYKYFKTLDEAIEYKKIFLGNQKK